MNKEVRLNVLLGRYYSQKERTCFGECNIPVLGMKLKRRLYLLGLFFKIDPCSAILFKRSRRELSIDVAEQRSMLKSNRNTPYPRFNFIPETGTTFLKMGVLFLLC